MKNKMNDENSRILIGLFNNRDNAEKAYEDLKENGYNADEIDVIMASDTRDKYYDDKGSTKSEMGSKAMEGAGKGSAIGGIAGGIGGALAALGTNLLIPGLGIVVLGPLAAGLAGAGAGGLTGGLIGALIGAGIPKEKADVYHEGLKNGKILIGVHPHSDEDARRLAEKWAEYQAEDVYS